MDITIQQAQFFDLKEIGNLFPYPSFLLIDLYANRFTEAPDYFVAKVDQEIVGFAQLTHNLPTESELMRIYILPDFQRKGIGSKLLKKCVSRLKKSTRLIVKVEKRNFAAIAFYESRGFQRIREIYNSCGVNLFEYWLYVR